MNRMFVALIFLFISHQSFSSNDSKTELFINFNFYFSKDVMFNYFKNECTKDYKSLAQLPLSEIKKIKAKADKGESLSQCKMAVISYQRGFHGLYNQWLKKASKTDTFSKLLLLHSYLFPEDFVMNNTQSIYELEKLTFDLMEEVDSSHDYYDLALNFRVLSYLELGYSWDSEQIRHLYEEGEKEKLSFVYLMKHLNDLFDEKENASKRLKNYINQTKGKVFYYLLSSVYLSDSDNWPTEESKDNNHLPMAEEIFKTGGSPIIIFTYIIPFYNKLKDEKKSDYWLDTFLKETKDLSLSKLAFNFIYHQPNLSYEKKEEMINSCVQSKNPYCQLYQLSTEFFSKEDKDTDQEAVYLKTSQVSEKMFAKDILLNLMSEQSEEFNLNMHVEKLLQYPGAGSDHILSGLFLKQAGKKAIDQGNFEKSKRLLTLSHNIFFRAAFSRYGQSSPVLKSELQQIVEHINFIDKKLAEKKSF